MFQSKLKNKDINLLEAYKTKNEPSKYTPVLKFAVFPIVSGIFVLSVFGYYTFSNNRLENDNSRVEALISNTNTDIERDPDLAKASNLSDIRVKFENFKKLYEDIESYPKMNQTIFDQLMIASGVSVEITSLSYSMESSVISLQVEVSSVHDAEMFVRRLKSTSAFADVQYSGYSQVEKSMKSVGSDEKATTKVYTATVLCTMK